MERTDTQLIAAIATGDDEAFSELYERHVSRVYSFLRKLLIAPGDTEDVCQETFWQVWLRARQYKPEMGSVSNWLQVLARSRGLDLIRRRKVRAEIPGLHQPLLLDPLESAARAEAGHSVGRAIESLPNELSKLIQLSFYHGLTHYQIANHTGLPLGTVKTRIRRGICLLRSRLSQAIR